MEPMPHPTASIEALRSEYRDLVERLEANHAEFQRLVRANFRAQENERRRIARDLHDGIGQNLTALKHQLALLLGGAPPLADTTRDGLAACIDLCSQTLADTRQISRLLRPQVLDDLGLAAALRWLARTIGQSGGLAVECQIGDLPELDDERQTVLFRVGQEALGNTLRHAQASQAGLRLAAHGRWLQLEVWDDGSGFHSDRVAGVEDGGGSGLGGMRERARAFGGRLHVDSTPGSGTRIRLMLPSGDDGGAP